MNKKQMRKLAIDSLLRLVKNKLF